MIQRQCNKNVRVSKSFIAKNAIICYAQAVACARRLLEAIVPVTISKKKLPPRVITSRYQLLSVSLFRNNLSIQTFRVRLSFKLIYQRVCKIFIVKERKQTRLIAESWTCAMRVISRWERVGCALGAILPNTCCYQYDIIREQHFIG